MVASSSSDEPRDGPALPDWRRSLSEAGPYLGLGMQIALSMALFVAIGYGVDAWLGTLPWGTIAGALIGMSAVFYHLVRVLDAMNRASTQKEEKKEARESASTSSAASGQRPGRADGRDDA